MATHTGGTPRHHGDDESVGQSMQDHDSHEGHDHGEDDELGACIEECLNCHIVCTLTAQQAISEGGQLADPNLIGVLMDCAEICQTSANFMLRGSPYHAITCAACAAICRECAEGCRSIEGNEDMAHCAEACERCAEHCERMAEGGEEDEAA